MIRALIGSSANIYKAGAIAFLALAAVSSAYFVGRDHGGDACHLKHERAARLQAERDALAERKRIEAAGKIRADYEERLKDAAKIKAALEASGELRRACGVSADGVRALREYEKALSLTPK